MTWKPSRISNRTVSGTVLRYIPWLPFHRFPDTSSPYESKLVESQRIGNQKLLVAFDKEGSVDIEADVLLAELEGKLQQAKAEIEAMLANENMVADIAGMTVELLLRIEGKTWPAIPEVTALREDCKCGCPCDDSYRCYDGKVYGPCTSDNCYGNCVYDGECVCPLHQYPDHVLEEREDD